MSKQTTAEYIMRMRGRYRAMLTKHARGRLLDEFCATTQLERKHAIKVLRSLHVPLRKAGRKPVYAGAATVLRQLWLLFASKLLHPVLASYVASYAKHRGGLQAQTKALLLHMSPSTMDRLLREHRVRTSLWRGHGGGPLAAMKRRVPVRSKRWEGRGPGWFEADTVAHGGGSMAGSFAYSLTFTETDSQWTELRGQDRDQHQDHGVSSVSSSRLSRPARDPPPWCHHYDATSSVSPCRFGVVSI